MRPWISFALVLLVALPLAAQTSTPPTVTAPKTPLVKLVEPPKPASFMFVQTAESGTFAPLDGSGGKRFRLTLNGVAPDTIYFSDRPQRIAGGTEMSKFLKAFPFAPTNPPNAAVVLTAPKSQDADVIIVELTNPVYDAQRHTLAYDVATLPQTPPGLAFYADKRDAKLPPSFDAVSLFIDDCPDQPAVCYGSFQCSGGQNNNCCRVGCGGLGYNVGTCWHWLPPGCSPCNDYSAQCNNGPCNGSSTFCQPNQCADDRQCM